MQNADNKVKAMILLEKKLVFLPVLLILLRIWGTLRYFLFIAKIEDNCGWEQIDNILKFLQVNFGVLNFEQYKALHLKRNLKNKVKDCKSVSTHYISTASLESSNRDLLIKYLFDGGYLPGKCVSVRGIRVSWKIVCVRGLDRGFLENEYLFHKKIEDPGKC